MDILNMTKEDFDAVPRLDTHTDWEKLAPNGRLEFSSFVIIPVHNEDRTIDLHESGWGCMEFCLIDLKGKPIGKVGGGSDVVNLDGIGGYRDLSLRFDGIPRTIPVHGWSIDLLPCGYLNVWTRRMLYIKDSIIGSNFEVFSDDERRR